MQRAIFSQITPHQTKTLKFQTVNITKLEPHKKSNLSGILLRKLQKS